MNNCVNCNNYHVTGCSDCPANLEKLTAETEILKEVVSKIWNIAKISPEHGNVLMDVLGDETYNKIALINNRLNITR